MLTHISGSKDGLDVVFNVLKTLKSNITIWLNNQITKRDDIMILHNNVM